MSESAIVKAILDAYAGHPRIELWRNNTGRRGCIQFGRVGQADITGIMDGGRRIEIECKKAGGVTNKERKAKQTEFGDMIRKLGGLHILAESVADVTKVLG